MREFAAALAGAISGWWLGEFIAQGYAVHGRAAFTIELALSLACTLSAGLAAAPRKPGR